MRAKLMALRAALLDIKKASVFKKALAVETALLAAVDLIEEIIDEIEHLKERKNGADK